MVRVSLLQHPFEVFQNNQLMRHVVRVVLAQTLHHAAKMRTKNILYIAQEKSCGQQMRTAIGWKGNAWLCVKLYFTS